jgi:hypothetical protein
MAKYSKKAQDKVEKVMHEMKEGTLKSGGSGKKVKNRKQAIAIGLSEAREAGARVPKKTGAKKTAKKATKKSPAKRSGAKKASPRKTAKKVTKKRATKRAASKKATPRKTGMKKRAARK